MSDMSHIDLTATHQMDLSQLESLIGADSWKLTPATMAHKITDGGWIAAKHLLYISAQVAYELNKGDARIIISMPPRHGKSELFSVHTPVWYLDKWPNKQVMALSYGADLAEEFGQRVRDIILQDADPDDGAHLLNPACHIRKDSARVSRFLTISGGGMRSVGIGGAVYGRGADLLLIDDYYKNLEEARSETRRKAIADWVMTVAMSRLHKGGSIIVTATRWDVDDLSAALLKATGSKFKEIRLPAFAELNDPLGRAFGEPLWNDFYPAERLNELKGGMGSFLFNAMYQQTPKIVSSDIFDRGWVQIVDELPHYSRLRFCRSWDQAGSPENGDYTAGLKMALDIETGDEYLIDMVHGQWAPGKVEIITQETAENDGLFTEVIIEEEPGSSGKATAERYTKTVLKGYNSKAIKHSGDKFVRALPFFAHCEKGKVKMLRGSWNDKFLDECCAFPMGLHDDQVDVASQAHNYFNGKKNKGGTWGRADRTDKVGPVRNGQAGSTVISGVTWGRRR